MQAAEAGCWFWLRKRGGKAYLGRGMGCGVRRWVDKRTQGRVTGDITRRGDRRPDRWKAERRRDCGRGKGVCDGRRMRGQVRRAMWQRPIRITCRLDENEPRDSE